MSSDDFMPANQINRRVQRPPKLSEIVANRMHELILNGEWSSGYRLPPERELCQSFGVSRAALREAIMTLLARGILRDMPGKGTFVWQNMTEPLRDLFGLFVARNNDNGRKLFEVRNLLEVEIAGLAAERATEEDIANLEKINRSMERLHRNGAKSDEESRVMRYNDLDFEFHLTLARSTKNEFFVILLAALSGAFISSWALMHVSAEVRGHGLHMHDRILEAIRAHDPRRARRCTRDNLRAFLADAHAAKSPKH
jgi:GntR family transcriptional repressor for pyruvate dehydrogenase complex